jgi:hypothetical protein
MKKAVFSILIASLIVGVPLMLLDFFYKDNDSFNIPKEYSKIEVDLSEKARNNESVFQAYFDTPKGFDLIIQSDSEEIKTIEVITEQKIIGRSDNKYEIEVDKILGPCSYGLNFISGIGNITVSLTNEKAEGKIVFGYKDRPIDILEYERLLKVDNGELNNPPKGYDKIFSADLRGQNFKDETIYTLTLYNPQNIGLSVYTDCTEGDLSVDLIGQGSSYYGIVSPNNFRICDQLEFRWDKGEYEIRLSSENANGQIYIFLKR